MSTLWIDGEPAAPIGAYGELTWTTLADGGPGEASWSMSLPSDFSHPALRRGKSVQVKAGSCNLFSGIMSEPDQGDDGWAFHADGLAAAFRGWMCLTVAGDTPSTPDVAIDAAIARGCPWRRPVSIGSTPFGTTDATNGLSTLGDLLDAYADSLGHRWGVDAYGNVYIVADPLTPSWYMAPGSGRFGLADDDYASVVYVRYRTGPTTYATAPATDTVAENDYGRKEVLLDATGYGVIDSATANGLASGALAKGKTRLGWTNPVEPSRWQITTPGGTPAYLPTIKGGQMVRLHGVLNTQGQPVPYVDFVVGQTSFADGASSITLTPTDMAARDLGSVMALAVSA